MSDPLLLLVEDEAPMRRFLRQVLQAHGYRLVEAATGREGLVMAASHNPELVLLDLGLPDLDGLEVLAEFRGWSRAPVIILSARGQEEDKIRGLDSGANDYLTKPFSTGELLARLRACLRYSSLLAVGAEEPVFESDGLLVDLANRQVSVDGTTIHLTPIEYRLLSEFVLHAGKVLTHRHLLREVWNVRTEGQNHYVRIYVHQLRRKIEADPARPRHLLSEPGVGYRLSCSPP